MFFSHFRSRFFRDFNAKSSFWPPFFFTYFKWVKWIYRTPPIPQMRFLYLSSKHIFFFVFHWWKRENTDKVSFFLRKIDKNQKKHYRYKVLSSKFFLQKIKIGFSILAQRFEIFKKWPFCTKSGQNCKKIQTKRIFDANFEGFKMFFWKKVWRQ